MKEHRKEIALEMFKMRLDGATYQEIADKYGVTRQNVEQILKIREPSKRHSKEKYKICIYKGLREWLEKNNYKLNDLQNIISKTKQRQAGNCLRMKLSGERDFRLSEINKIINLTGMTFEELFMQE